MLPGAVHIHFGPAPLGLGLPIAVTLEAGFDTHVVGKPERAHPPFFNRTIFGRSGIVTIESNVQLASFTSPDREVIPEEIAAAIGGAHLVLITVSMREHVTERAELILRIIDRVPASSEVVFLACENTLCEGHRELIAKMPPRVRVLRTVVDRVCTWQNWPKSHREPPFPRDVLYHEIGEWIIEEPRRGSLKESLEKVDEVVFARADTMTKLEARKAWFVNGMHLDLAIRGRAANHTDLRLVVNDEELLEMLQPTIAMMQFAIERKHQLHVPEDWVLDRLIVVSQLPDSPDRVLKSLTRANPSAFLERFEKRIAEPARVAASNRAIPPTLESLAHDLVEILQDGDQYSDWQTLDFDDLSEQGDAVAVRAFRKAMTGWMPASFIDREARRLQRALRSHRVRPAYG